MESMLKTTTPSVSDIFNNMEYGPASESDKVRIYLKLRDCSFIWIMLHVPIIVRRLSYFC